MSHGRDKARSRRNRAMVRELFMREWDPIGVAGISGAEDEYDSYGAKAYVMLMDEQASAIDIAEYLLWVESERMRMAPTQESRQRCRHVAEALVALLPKFQS